MAGVFGRVCCCELRDLVSFCDIDGFLKGVLFNESLCLNMTYIDYTYHIIRRISLRELDSITVNLIIKRTENRSSD